MKLDLNDLGHYFDFDTLLKWVSVVMAALVFLLIAYGCSSVPKQAAPLRTFSIARTPQDDLEKKFQEVIDYCLPRLQGYEEKAMEQSDKAFWMNMSGLLSGAVFVPMIIASGSTAMWPMMLVSGLSGWAGATPFASDALRLSGHSGEAVAKMRNDIVKRIRDKIAVALDGTKLEEERWNALMGVVAECTVYPMVIPSMGD